MTRPTPRQRAAAAFAVIDRHHDAMSSVCPMYAYAQLAEAMEELYGPLPDERLHQAVKLIEREEQ